MMKKSNLKRIIIGVISFALIVAIGFSYCDAEAKNDNNNNNNNNNNNKNSCVTNLADYNPEFEKVENKDKIKIETNKEIKGVLEFTNIREANTSVVAKVTCSNNINYEITNNKTVEIELPEGGKCTIDYDTTNTGFKVMAVLFKPDTAENNCAKACERPEVKNGENLYIQEICDKYKNYVQYSQYVQRAEYEFFSKSSDKIHNSSRDNGGVCYKFINSDKDFFIKKLGLSEEEYNNYSPSKLGAGAYASTLPYCYASDQEYVDAEYDDSQLISTMKLAVKTKKFNSMSNSNKVIQINGNDFNLSNGRDAFEKYFIDNTKNGGEDKSLRCNAFILEQHAQGKTAEENYYVNNATYSAYSITTDSKTKEQTGSYSYQCKKTCKETIKVSYGPPVGRLAGLCFEYKVKVKSIVDCSATFNGEPPTMPKPPVCTTTPYCGNNSAIFANQAGPNEKFDSCVIKCDGGKYTDKCTNKCYKKVYSNSTRKLALSYNGINAKQIANTSDCYGEYAKILGRNLTKICNGKTNARALKNDGSECSQAIKDIVNLKGQYGSYEKAGGSITWVPSKGKGYDYTGCRWAKYSPFYFTYNSYSWSGSYEPERTVLEDEVANPSGNTTIIGGVKYFPDKNGFKRRSNAGGCREYCWYQQSGTCNSTKQEYENKVEKYKKDLADYENAMSSCTAKVTCTEKTAEFTIKVNNKLKNQNNKDNWIEYGVVGLTPNNNAKIVEKSKTKTDFILDHNSAFGTSNTEKGSTCYGDNIENQNTYLTEWSFSGTWENQKNGKITYELPTDDKAWQFKKGIFCTSLDSAEVNKVWWNYKDKLQSVTDSEKTAILSDLEYNIFATARNFGYFGWNFDFKCFYSYSNSEPPKDCTDEDCPTPSKEDEPTPDTYINRSINLDDNFPEEVASSLLNDPSKVGREQGYNWKLEASNVKNKDYEVLPSALTTSIQSRRQEIYDESKSDKYKDYEFILDKKAMSEIRRYNKELKYNYKKFGETSTEGITSKNGITCYKSSLIRNSNYVNSTIARSKYDDELCVNNYNENESDETSVKSIATRNDYIQSLRALMQGGER